MKFIYWKLLRKKYFRLPYYILRSSISDTIRQDGIEHAGYLAFLFILSLFPFLIFLVSIASYFGSSDIGSQLVEVFLRSMPGDISSALKPRVSEIVTGPPQSLLTVAIIGIIWTASSNVEGMRTILNRAYRVENTPSYVLRRFLSILQFFVIALTIMITMTLLVLIPAIMKKIELDFFINFKIDYDWLYLRHVIIFIVLLIGTSLLYYAIPNAKQRFSNTVPGSILCIIFWAIILKLFGIYLEKFNQFNLLYGSLGGIIGSLIFFYLVSLIFIFGAEFNYHFTRTYLKNFRRRK